MLACLTALFCGTARRAAQQTGATLADSLYYFDSVRLFPEDSLSAAVNFGKANHQEAVYRLSSGEEIRLVEDVKPAHLQNCGKMANFENTIN